MSRDLTFIPDHIQESATEFLRYYNKKKKNRCGLYEPRSKKDMETWLHEAAHIMQNLLSETRHSKDQ
jgi:hypothetical protein